MLHKQWDNAPTLVRNQYDDVVVKLEIEHRMGYKISTYTFDRIDGSGIKGKFIHLAASKKVIQEPGGPDEMFAAVQTEDLGLERRRFAVSKMSAGKSEDAKKTSPVELIQSQQTLEQDEEVPQSRKPGFEGGDLMTAFSMNYGMPYKFVASGASKALP